MCRNIFLLCISVEARGVIRSHFAQVIRHVVQYLPTVHKCLSTWCNISPLCTGAEARGAISSHCAHVFKHVVRYLPIVHRCLSTWCNIFPLCLNTWRDVFPLCKGVCTFVATHSRCERVLQSLVSGRLPAGFSRCARAFAGQVSISSHRAQVFEHVLRYLFIVHKCISM